MSCQLQTDQYALCIDYNDIDPDTTSFVKSDCIGGVFSTSSLCQVASGTLGCKLYNKDLRGYQTIWYPSISDVQTLCSSGAIVSK